jgi:hypothetical protein
MLTINQETALQEAYDMLKTVYDSSEFEIDEIARIAGDLITYFPSIQDDAEYSDDEVGDGMTDAEADADTLRSAGWGTDEDYSGHPI